MHRSTHNLRGFDQLEPRLVLAGDILIDTQPPTVSITSSNPVMRLGAPATLTFTLSEDATGFDASDLGVSAGLGTLSNFEGSGRTYTATLTPTMAFNDRRQVAVWVEAGRLTDLAGNVNDKQSASFTIDNFPADTTPPTVTITGDRTILNRGGSTRITFKLSEPAADFTDGDVTVTPDMGTLSSLARLKSDASGLTYTAWFTAAQNVSGIGTAVISVASNSFTDAAGNGNLAASLSLTIDAVLPTLTITTSTPSLRRGQTATITFTLSEYSNTFSDSAVTVTNGTLSNFRGSGQTYSATFTPKNGFTGTGTVSVAAGAFRDPSGNANATGASVGIAIDTWPPSVCISSDRTVLVPGSMIDRTVLKPGDSTRITFRLSEPSADFTATDVSVTPNMGTLTSFAQLQSDASGLTYTALFTAAQNLSGNSTACISVASNAFTDAAGNGNLSASLSLTIDAVPPTVTITGDRTILNRGGETRITFRLSEPAADFTDGDVTVTPGMGTLSSLTRLKSDASGLTYTAWFTAAQNVSGIGTAVISVASNSFTDAAGNGNLAASLSLTIDAVLPTITITTSTPSLRMGQTATITFTLSEYSNTFGDSAVTVTKGTLSNFRGSGRTYSATFTPKNGFTGTGTVSVAAGAFRDLSGNANATGASVCIAIDTRPPSVCISSDRTVLVPGSMIDRTVLKPGDSTRITFRLSEPSADFTATDVSVTPNMGTLTSFAQLQSDASGLTYTALFTAAQNLSGNSTACISVASNAFTDAAGNGNLSASLSLTIDAVPPTVTITGDRTILNRGGETRITFRLSEPAADFTDGDVTVTPGMGTLSSLTRLKSDASGLTYTAWFTAAQNVSGIGTAVISVASNSFTDAAGNGNLAASLSLTIDAVLPTLTITTSTPSLRRGQTATITFTFSEDVVGFTPSAVTFVNGTLTNFRGSGRIYTATFTPRANFVGFGSAFVRAGAFTDLAGNANLEARLQVQLPTAP